MILYRPTLITLTDAEYSRFYLDCCYPLDAYTLTLTGRSSSIPLQFYVFLGRTLSFSHNISPRCAILLLSSRLSCTFSRLSGPFSEVDPYSGEYVFHLSDSVNVKIYISFVEV